MAQADMMTKLRRAAINTIVFLGFFVIFTSAARELLLRDPDLYWHITVGAKILSTGTLPWTDEYSHTFRGQPWIAKEWLSQVVLAKTYDLAGWYGITALMGVAVAGTYTLLLGVLAERMRLVPALIGTLFAYTLSATHFIARPHLLTFPLLVLWTAAVVRAADARVVPSIYWVLIMALWANLHSGFTLGLALAAGLAAEGVLAADPSARARVALRWTIFLGAACAAALATPYGYQSALMTYKLFGGNESLKYLTEWHPLNFGKDRIAGHVLLLGLFAALYYGVRFPFVRCAITMAMIYLMLKHFRFIALSAIVIPLLIAAPITQQFTQLGVSRVRETGAFEDCVTALRRPAALVAALTIACLAAVSSMYFPERSPLRAVAPSGAVDYLRTSATTGKIYNEYGFGGYLIFRGVQTFVDGRADQLFGGGFLDALFSALDGPKADFLRLLDRYEIAAAIVRPGSPETLRLDDAAGWRKVYFDDVSVVYERVTPPNASR